MSHKYSKQTSKWSYRFKYQGQTYKGSTDGGGTEEDVMRMELARRRELRDIENGYEPDKTIDDAITAVLESHFKHLSKPKGYYSHADCVRKLFNPKRPLTDIYLVGAIVREEMLDNDFSANTINQRLNILSQAAKHATNLKWLHAGSVGEFKRFKYKPRTVWLEKEEVARLAEYAPNPLLRDLIIFGAYTGLRTAEIWRIKQMDVSNNGADLHVRGKGNKERHIPIDEESAEFIKRYCPIQSHLLKGTKIQQMIITCTNAVNGIKDDDALVDKIREFTFHDLRHCYGTWLGKDGVDFETIMRFMGHATVLMAKIYIDRSTDDLRANMTKKVGISRKAKLRSVRSSAQ